MEPTVAACVPQERRGGGREDGQRGREDYRRKGRLRDAHQVLVQEQVHVSPFLPFLGDRCFYFGLPSNAEGAADESARI